MYFSSRHLIRSTFDSTFFVKVIIIVFNAVLELCEYTCIEGTNLVLLVVMDYLVATIFDVNFRLLSGQSQISYIWPSVGRTFAASNPASSTVESISVCKVFRTGKSSIVSMTIAGLAPYMAR